MRESFNLKTKNEIIASFPIDELDKVQFKTFAYGLLLFCRGFFRHNILILTTSENIINLYKKILENIVDENIDYLVSKSKNYSINIDDRKLINKIFNFLDIDDKDISFRLNRGLIEREEDFGLFMAGVFLACGQVTDPKKDYHLEFSVAHKKLSLDLEKFISDANIKIKKTIRQETFILYLKDSSLIEDFLVLMGASDSSLDLMDVKIYKDIKNRVNRKTNFENANLTKTAHASLNQIQAIEKIIEKKGEDFLSPDLKKIAKIRTENPEMSIREIGKNMNPECSGSVIYHKLQKIIKMAKDLED
ncbi:MAG: DNA-binding protein WhiA [Clostridia bacterium]|nr:DNA-binding protein WhiA [Clostridia bacterium]